MWKQLLAHHLTFQQILFIQLMSTDGLPLANIHHQTAKIFTIQIDFMPRSTHHVRVWHSPDLALSHCLLTRNYRRLASISHLRKACFRRFSSPSFIMYVCKVICIQWRNPRWTKDCILSNQSSMSHELSSQFSGKNTTLDVRLINLRGFYDTRKSAPNHFVTPRGRMPVELLNGIDIFRAVCFEDLILNLVRISAYEIYRREEEANSIDV